MTAERLVRVSRTPGSGITTSAAVSGLPRDLLAVATGRLGIVALATLAVTAVNFLVAHLLGPTVGNHWRWGSSVDVVTGSAAALSIAVYVYTRRTTADPLHVINVGLVYEVALCALVAILSHFGFASSGVYRSEVSWACPLLVMFPAIVPTTPKRTMIAALIGASLDPLAMVIAMYHGAFSAPKYFVLWMHFPNYICAGLGIMISRVITTIGRELRDARDLGSYRLGAIIGRGGMGEVYRAEHRMLVRPAAIKLIRPERLAWTDEHVAQIAIERFKREAQAVALLKSPHTIELYDFGLTDQGTFYFVMELLDGVDLSTFVERYGPMPPARVAHVLQQACDSLAEAHAYGLVHRDVKPANLHLCRQGLRHDFVKVLDFGLVKPQRPEALGGAGQLTAQDVVAGTPGFMAPEAVLGHELDGRADIYGLGCVGYWLLTGQLLFDAATSYQILARHVEAIPDPPSRRSELPVPQAMDDLILGCLHKDPAARPDAAELARQLDEYARQDPWTDDHARRWWEAHEPTVILRLATPLQPHRGDVTAVAPGVREDE